MTKDTTPPQNQHPGVISAAYDRLLSATIFYARAYTKREQNPPRHSRARRALIRHARSFGKSRATRPRTREIGDTWYRSIEAAAEQFASKAVDADALLKAARKSGQMHSHLNATLRSAQDPALHDQRLHGHERYLTAVALLQPAKQAQASLNTPAETTTLKDLALQIMPLTANLARPQHNRPPRDRLKGGIDPASPTGQVIAASSKMTFACRNSDPALMLEAMSDLKALVASL